MRRVYAHNVLAIDERAFLLGRIIIIVPFQCLAEKVLRTSVMCGPQDDLVPYQTMQVVKAFDIRRETSAVLLAHFHLVMSESGSLSFILGYHDTSILHGSQNW
jgi:hypothetical protein